MNIEHRTSNIEHRMEKDVGIISGAERHHYSTFDVQCSMLDVHLLNETLNPEP